MNAVAAPPAEREPVAAVKDATGRIEWLRPSECPPGTLLYTHPQRDDHCTDPSCKYAGRKHVHHTITFQRDDHPPEQYDDTLRELQGLYAILARIKAVADSYGKGQRQGWDLLDEISKLAAVPLAAPEGQRDDQLSQIENSVSCIAGFYGEGELVDRVKELALRYHDYAKGHTTDEVLDAARVRMGLPPKWAGQRDDHPTAGLLREHAEAALIWLDAAVKCEQFLWDADQLEAAKQSAEGLRAALASKPI